MPSPNKLDWLKLRLKLMPNKRPSRTRREELEKRKKLNSPKSLPKRKLRDKLK
jgi:hypothetical protein